LTRAPWARTILLKSTDHGNSVSNRDLAWVAVGAGD